VVYAIVRAGGRQEKVAVGDVITLDRLQEEVGGNVELPAVLLVDGDKVTSDADSLAGVKVQAKVLGHERGQKIVIQKYKNTTGYKKRQGFRAALSKVEITSIA
jgi:large subunit ribosomal protein L21